MWWAHTLDWLYDSLSSPPVAGVWWAVRTTWLASLNSLSSPPVAGVCEHVHLIVPQWRLLSSPPVSWCCGELRTLIGSLILSSPLLSTCSWCVVSAYTWLSLWLLSSPPVAGVWWERTLDCLYDSLSLSTCSWCVVRAYTWLSLWLSLLSTCSWCVVRAYTWLSLWLSLLSTCCWCVVSAYTWLALWLSLLSTCSWSVVRAYTWLALWLSLLSTFSWSVVSIYTWLSLCLSLLSTCSWCVVSALAPLSCGSRRIIQVDAAHWWWLRRPPPPHTHMIVKYFACTTIHNKALYRCIIHSSANIILWPLWDFEKSPTVLQGEKGCEYCFKMFSGHRDQGFIHDWLAWALVLVLITRGCVILFKVIADKKSQETATLTFSAPRQKGKAFIYCYYHAVQQIFMLDWEHLIYLKVSLYVHLWTCQQWDKKIVATC